MADAVRVLVIATEQVGERMAGPAIRSLELARCLAAAGMQVTLATPRATALPDDPSIRTAAYGTPNARGMRVLAEDADVVFTQPHRVDVAVALHRSRARVVYDLYVPSFVERIAQLGVERTDERLRRRLLERDRREYAAAVRLGDAFVCASERQKDHWLGALGQAGRLDLELLTREPRAEELLAVVPFGCPQQPPAELVERAPRPMRGRLVPEDAVVLLWTGGIWNWFDPVTVVEALAEAREHDPRLHLVVMGGRHPEAHWEPQEAEHAMRARAEELGLLAAGAVVFGDGWVPYDERAAWLLDADLAVSAHFDTLETRLSFRTRFLDQCWAGVPTIATRGDELAQRMADAGAAVLVDEGDVEGWAETMGRLAGDVDGRRAMSVAARMLADELRWQTASEPLVRTVTRLAASVDGERARRLSRRDLLAYAVLLIRIRVQAKGLRSLSSALRGAAGR